MSALLTRAVFGHRRCFPSVMKRGLRHTLNVVAMVILKLGGFQCFDFMILCRKKQCQFSHAQTPINELVIVWLVRTNGFDVVCDSRPSVVLDPKELLAVTKTISDEQHNGFFEWEKPRHGLNKRQRLYIRSYTRHSGCYKKKGFTHFVAGS